jgi:hypothetical protein
MAHRKVRCTGFIGDLEEPKMHKMAGIGDQYRRATNGERYVIVWVDHRRCGLKGEVQSLALNWLDLQQLVEGQHMVRLEGKV